MYYVYLLFIELKLLAQRYVKMLIYLTFALCFCEESFTADR